MEFHYSAAAICAATGFAKSVQLETASNGFRMDGMIDYGKRLKYGFCDRSLILPAKKSWKILPSGIPKTETGFEFRCMNEIAMDKFESE